MLTVHLLSVLAENNKSENGQKVIFDNYEKIVSCTEFKQNHIVEQAVGTAVIKTDAGQHMRATAVSLLAAIIDKANDYEFAKNLLNVTLKALTDPKPEVSTKAVFLLKKLSFLNGIVLQEVQDEIIEKLTIFERNLFSQETNDEKNDILEQNTKLDDEKIEKFLIDTAAALSIAHCNNQKVKEYRKRFEGKSAFSSALSEEKTFKMQNVNKETSIYKFMTEFAPEIALIFKD